ncbi:MAG: hypothetical protein CALGDGBN_00692 [Pseudomonadales bacterium]|nr:hypothetical protein [Pseudomonadales bacterium]
MEDFYALRVGPIWRYFKGEHFSFWMVCAYFFVEYVRPQSILPALDILPWAQTFLIFALVGWLVSGQKYWPSHVINWLIGTFLLTILVSTLSASHRDLALRKLPDAYTWFIIYLLVINIVNTRKRFFIVLFIFLVASFKISLSLSHTWAMRGFSFTSWGLKGPPGFFENSGELAIQMAVYGPIALAAAGALSPFAAKWKRYALYAMPITAAMVILGASSRGGQIALFVQALLSSSKKIYKIRNLILVTVISSAVWLALPQEQIDRFSAIGEDKTSQQRLLYWRHGLEMLNTHPVSGVGFFNFIPYYASHFPHDVIVEKIELPHNIFVQVGSELGYPGLVAYIAILVALWRTGSKISALGLLVKTEDNGFSCRFGKAANVSLVGFVVAGQFVSVVYYPFLWIHAALVVAMHSVLLREIAICREMSR